MTFKANNILKRCLGFCFGECFLNLQLELLCSQWSFFAYGPFRCSDAISHCEKNVQLYAKSPSKMDCKQKPYKQKTPQNKCKQRNSIVSNDASLRFVNLLGLLCKVDLSSHQICRGYFCRTFFPLIWEEPSMDQCQCRGKL